MWNEAVWLIGGLGVLYVLLTIADKSKGKPTPAFLVASQKQLYVDASETGAGRLSPVMG